MKKIKKVLLVDDDSVTNYLNKIIMSYVDVAEEVILKTNGKEALSFLKEECKEGTFPDLILLDLKMPVMDGFEFLKEFETFCGSLKQTVYVVVLTTSKEADDLILLRQLGNYYFINKPLTEEKLLDIHHRYFRDLNAVK